MPGNKESRARANRKYWKTDKGKATKFRANIKSEYGISIEERDKLLSEQDFACAICGVLEVNLKKKLAIDHCHTSQKVRGLLCTVCNLGLGKFKDDPSLLLKAAEYIKCRN